MIDGEGPPAGESQVRVRNATATKAAVLASAERLFAERGFAGTSMRDLAAASGVSQPLIQHHFGGKDALYAAVLRHSMEDFVERTRDEATRTDLPISVAEDLTRLFAFLCAHASVMRIIGWARLEGKHDLVSGCEGIRLAMIGRIVRGQELGLVRTDIDAPSLAVMLEGLLIYWFENKALNRVLFDHEPDDEAFLRKAILLLERGIAPATPGA
ncbi:TetR/AcrR family transcriptional regulator [Isosphaeraceae bacterium EP7]